MGEGARQGLLEPLSHEPRNDGPQAVGLLGHNKPNGIDQRYRRVVPSGTPAFVPRELDELNLAIADAVPEGWLALYESGDLAPNENHTYRAILYAHDGSRVWDLILNRFLSARTRLEIQDMRYQDRKLYFNEACPSYAREAQGRCSALLRVNPARKALEWRSRNLVSNDIFILHGPWAITGYGFTAEPDSLYLIERASGRIRARAGLDTAHDYLEVKDGVLHVVTYRSVYRFALPR